MPHRVDLGAPRVGADPVEVARLAAPHRRREQLPGIDGNRSDYVSQDDGKFFSRIEARRHKLSVLHGDATLKWIFGRQHDIL